MRLASTSTRSMANRRWIEAENRLGLELPPVVPAASVDRKRVLNKVVKCITK